MAKAVVDDFQTEGDLFFDRHKRWALPLLIVLVGYSLYQMLVYLQRKPPKAPVATLATLVEVVEAQPRTERVSLFGYGTVEAKRELEIRPQVNGHIVEVHPALQVGGRVKSGEVLVKIDPRDYEIAVEGKKAALKRSEFELKIEKANQVVAKREWSLLEKDMQFDSEGAELALRKPHLQEKEAAFRAAQSQLKKAELDLERTEMRAPFAAIVLKESVEVGKYISPQTEVLQLAATDEFYVQVKLPGAALRWLPQMSDRSVGLQVRIIQQFGSGEQLVREGRLVRLIGEVDAVGRMARVLVSILNPLDEEDGKTPLLLGSYVRVELAGKEVSGVIAIPREALRQGGVVWIVDPENKLEVAPVEQVFARDDLVFIRAELDAQSQIIVSPLQSALRGSPLEVAKKRELPL